MATQTSTGYHADLWIVVDLEPMTKLVAGHRWPQQLLFSEEDARAAKGAYVGTKAYKFAETLWRHAQVEPSPTLSYRDGIREYVVESATRAGVCVCRENPQLRAVSSVVQYFLPRLGKPLPRHRSRRSLSSARGAYPKLF
jgi:hypothetical protein